MFALLAQCREGRPGAVLDFKGRTARRARLRERLDAFQSDARGDVALVFGLLAVVMFLFMGAAVDFGRWLHARNQTLTAMDAAVLAGGRALQLNSKDINGAKAAAQRFYIENTKTRIAVKNDTITFAPTDQKTAFEASGNAFIETPILGLANITQLPLVNASKGEYSRAELQVGGNAELNLEISLMLDVSGSMGGSKIRDLKDAAEDLVDIVVWEDQSEYTSKVAIAPFSASMRPPASMLSSLRGNLPSFKDIPCGRNCTRRYHLTPCVAERPGANKYTDAAPGAGNYLLGVYETNSSCSPAAAASIEPLTNNKTALHAAVNGLPTGGMTAGHLGTAWAWYLLSPNWASVFPAASAPVAYGTPKTEKIAILMTDGEFNTQYDSEGIATSSGGAVNGSSYVQARALCDGMKLAGITVYTVGFDLRSGSSAANHLAYCATSPGHAYLADDGDELKQAFRDIALKISSLYLSK